MFDFSTQGGFVMLGSHLIMMFDMMPGLLTWINFNSSIDTFIIPSGMKLFIHSQTSIVQLLKFGYG